MTAAFFLALQAAATPPGVLPVPFDLGRLDQPRYDANDPIALPRCARGDGAAIVVCGRRSGGDYPIARWALIFSPERPLRAETDLGGGATGRIYTEAVPLDRGLVSQRAMVGISIDF